jgi:hypothetical protein
VKQFYLCLTSFLASIFFVFEISVQNLDVGKLNGTKQKEDKPKNEIPVRLRFR